MPSGYLLPRRLAWQWFDLQFIHHSQSMSLHPLISAWFQSSSISFKRPTSNNLYQPAFGGKVLHFIVHCAIHVFQLKQIGSYHVRWQKLSQKMKSEMVHIFIWGCQRLWKDVANKYTAQQRTSSWYSMNIYLL